MKKTLFAIFAAFVLPTFMIGQSQVIPIAELRTDGLMGGVQNGKWIAPALVAPMLKSETEFVLIGNNGVEEGGVTIGKKIEEEDVCPDFNGFEFELEQESGVAIGSEAKWNFTPRVPQAIDLTNPTYKAVVANFLRKKGIMRPNVKLREAYRVDLDGDGVDEVVIGATYYRRGLYESSSIGDYSFVMVRSVKGKIVTDHLLEGDFIAKRSDMAMVMEFHLSAIADLNGDGKMEVVVHGFYYEGNNASAFEMKKGVPVRIKEFDIECGV